MNSKKVVLVDASYIIPKPHCHEPEQENRDFCFGWGTMYFDREFGNPDVGPSTADKVVPVPKSCKGILLFSAAARGTGKCTKGLLKKRMEGKKPQIKKVHIWDPVKASPSFDHVFHLLKL